MKERPKRFLSEENIPHNGEIFGYIKELHEYLWQFTRIAIPGANGDLALYVDAALKVLEEKTK